MSTLNQVGDKLVDGQIFLFFQEPRIQSQVDKTKQFDWRGINMNIVYKFKGHE